MPLNLSDGIAAWYPHELVAVAATGVGVSVTRSGGLTLGSRLGAPDAVRVTAVPDMIATTTASCHSCLGRIPLPLQRAVGAHSDPMHPRESTLVVSRFARSVRCSPGRRLTRAHRLLLS